MTQYQDLAQIIASKLNTIIGKVNTHTQDVADINGGSLDTRYYTETEIDGLLSDSTVSNLSFDITDGIFTLTKGDGSTVTVDLDGRFTDNEFADVMDQGVAIADAPTFAGVEVGTLDVSELTSNLIPSVDSTKDLGASEKQYNDLHLSGQIYQSGVPIQSAEAKPLVYHETFIGDGATTEFVVSKTMTSLVMVDVNGLVQEKDDAFTHVEYEKTITFNEAPIEGDTVQITYFYGGSKPVLRYQKFVADGSLDSVTVSENLSQVVYVEINGLVQLMNENYSTNGQTINFAGVPSNGSEIAVLYYNTGDSSVSGTTNRLAKFGDDGLSVTDSLISEGNGAVTVEGNLYVTGETFTVNSTEVTIEDKAIVVGSGATNEELLASPAGVKIGDENLPLASILFDGNKWKFDGEIDSSTVINKTQQIVLDGAVTGSATINNLGDISVSNVAFDRPSWQAESDLYIGTYFEFRDQMNGDLGALI